MKLVDLLLPQLNSHSAQYEYFPNVRIDLHDPTMGQIYNCHRQTNRRNHAEFRQTCRSFGLCKSRNKRRRRLLDFELHRLPLKKSFSY